MMICQIHLSIELSDKLTKTNFYDKILSAVISIQNSQP